MYGKIFASTFTGSMYGAGVDVFAVWAYVLANTYESQVELNPMMLAAALGSTPDKVEQAIAFLCAPDPRSRSKTEEGRRLIREGEFAYRVPNFDAYRKIRNEEERREYNRVKKAEQRERQRGVKARVNDCQRKSAQTETETEAETNTKTVNSYTGISHEIPDQPTPDRFTEDGRRLIKNPNGTGWMPVEDL